jgi:hypothetical protein
MHATPFVSTGELPDSSQVIARVKEAHELFRTNDDGTASDVYPALARVSPGLFGICVAAVDGRVHAVGDADVEFTIMSVAKPFVFALVCDALGAEEVRAKLGVNSTGLPFNAPEAIERSVDGRTNPMVNPGAIAATSLAPGATAAENGGSSATASPASPAVRSAWTRRCTNPRRRRTRGTEASRSCSSTTTGSTPTRRRLSTCTRGRAA